MGLKRYQKIWRSSFQPFKALNHGIGGDRTQHVLWRAINSKLPKTLTHAVIHCGTNNIDHDLPVNIANGIMTIGLALQEKCPDLKVIITGLIPRDLNWSKRRRNIKETNAYLEQYCKEKYKDFYYMKQDADWVLDDQRLNEKYYYTDRLHLIETGNEKFSKKIMKFLSELINNGAKASAKGPALASAKASIKDSANAEAKVEAKAEPKAEPKAVAKALAKATAKLKQKLKLQLKLQLKFRIKLRL